MGVKGGGRAPAPAPEPAGGRTTLTLRKGDSGVSVKALQKRLLRLGYALPRWGVDGQLGDEVLSAANEFALEEGLPAVDEEVSDQLLELLAEKADRAPGEGEPQDHTKRHATPKPTSAKPRGWSDITGITLHQTACDLGEKAKRWYTIPVQMGVTKSGAILLLNPLTLDLPHGNGLNAATVGLEIDGRYAGIEGNVATFWRPPGDTSKPQRAPDAQLAGARAAVRWVCEEVARRGGQIKTIHAHRQANALRQSDPGSRIWQEVGCWAQNELGLSDGGDGFRVGKGLALPAAWDPTRTAKY